MCTNETHADIKNDPERWATEVEFIGEMDIGGGQTVMFANCRVHSTLALDLSDRAPRFKRAV